MFVASFEMQKRPAGKPNKLEPPCKVLKEGVPLSTVAEQVKPSANCNEIWNLNSDCLLLVFSHLSKPDLFALCVADERFRDLLLDSRMFKGQLDIDKEFLERFPLNSKHIYIYKGIGQLTKDIRISVPYSQFTGIMPYLQDIDTLELTKQLGYIPMYDSQLKLIPRVRCLRGDFFFSGGGWQRLLRHLAPTLEELDCSRVKLCYLQGLDNLTTLTMNANLVKRGFGVLFQRSPKLEGLRVRFLKGSWVRDWTNISNRRAIKKLHLDFVILSIPIGGIILPGPGFPHLRSFRLSMVEGKCELLHMFLDKLSHKLRELTIDFDVEDSWNSAEFNDKLAKFKELKQLNFTKAIPMESFSLDGILRLVSLTHLTLPVASAEWTFLAIDRLPNLVEMNNYLTGLGNWAFAEQLRTMLQERKRKLEYNGSKWWRLDTDYLKL